MLCPNSYTGCPRNMSVCEIASLMISGHFSLETWDNLTIAFFIHWSFVFTTFVKSLIDHCINQSSQREFWSCWNLFIFLKNAIFIFWCTELDVMRIFTIVVSTHHQPPGYMQYRSNSTLSYHKYSSIVEICETNQNLHSIPHRFKHVT